MSMPESDSRWPQPELAWFDRLVDGELSPAEQRELVARLEAEPEGWRRLALAFLEAQAWRQDIRAAGDELLVLAAPKPANAPEPRVVPASIDRPAVSRRHGPPVPGWFALAASLLVAFGLGSWSAGGRNPWVPAPGGSGGPLTQRGPQLASVPLEASANLAGVSSPWSASAEPAAVSLVWADGAASSSKPVQLPVISPDESWEAWLAQPEMQESAPADRILSRLGHRVNRIRQLVPVTLDDGRVAEVPVERVQIRYVADDYQ